MGFINQIFRELFGGDGDDEPKCKCYEAPGGWTQTKDCPIHSDTKEDEPLDPYRSDSAGQ